MEMTFEAALRDLRSSRSRARAAAADALAGLDDPSAEQWRAAVGALRRATRDDDAKVRYSAACTLADLGAEEAAPRLLQMIEDADSIVRQAAVAALGELRIEYAFDRLQAVLEHGNADVRFQAAVSLAQIDMRRAVGPLLAALDDIDSEVRSNAAAALGDAAGENALDDEQSKRARTRLTEMLGEDLKEDLRFEVALALAAMGDRAATSILAKNLVSLSRGLAAAEALGTLGDPAALPALRRIRGRIWSPRLLRVACSAALLMMGEEDEEQFLMARARRGSADVRGLALAGLGYAAGDAGRELLCQIAGAHRDTHAANAVVALEHLGDSRALPVLEHVAADHPDAETREVAAHAVQELRRDS